MPRLAPIPITYFGAVLGLGGLAGAWRAASRVWRVTPLIGEALAVVALGVWMACCVLFVLTWWRDRVSGEADFRDPTRSSFAALLPMATLVAALVFKPYAPGMAWGMAVVGLWSQVAIAIWTTAAFWRGDRAAETVTPIMLMPAVGACFVSAIAAVAFGHPSLGPLFFGAGFFSWVVTESLVLQRLVSQALPPPLRATLGIHFAPPAIACLSYLAITEGPPDRFAQMMFGYALLQGLVLVRLVPWLRRQAFSHRVWAYTFGVSALPTAAFRFAEADPDGAIAAMTPAIFLGANLIIGWISLRSIVTGVVAYRRASLSIP